jgi:hypothetical protein
MLGELHKHKIAPYLKAPIKQIRLSKYIIH